MGILEGTILGAILWNVGGWAATTLGIASISAAGIYALGATTLLIGGSLVFGGVSLMVGHKDQTGSASSPTYGGGVLQSQTNNTLPVPLLYGEVKVAGNRLWQDDNVSTHVTRLVSFAEGEINAFNDIRLNDIKSSEMSGITIQKFYGTSDQLISDLIPGAINAARAEVVGGMKYKAYLAIKVPRSDKIDGSYNLTTVAQGRKVRAYTDEDTYTVAYSNNPAWCLLDFLTCYNGGRIGVLNTGLRDDALIKQAIDINSFIESAAYCDEVITSYQYTTALTGDNNDIFWIGRKSNTPLTLTYTAGASLSASLVGNDLTITYVAGTTTANDVISLIQSNPAIFSVVNLYNADNNNGTGLISALAKTNFVADNTSKRFTFNMIFDSNWLNADIIEEFKKNCRGALVTGVKTNLPGELVQKLQFKIEKPESVSKVFTKDSIIQGSETVKTIERGQRYDILDLEYIEPNIASEDSGEWAKNVSRATLDEYFNEPAISHKVQMYSVTNFKQAARLAWYYLNRNVRCYFEGSFSTDHRGRDVEVGDVIQLNDFVMNFTNFSVKVASVQETQEGVFTISWFQYDPTIYNDELASLDPIIISTNLNDPYAYPGDVQSFNASQNQRLVEFSWTTVDGAETYEIRQGANWDSATIIATGLTGTAYSATLTQRGIFTYWIKSRTKYQYSINATSDILNVQFLPDLNIVVSQDILESTIANLTDDKGINVTDRQGIIVTDDKIGLTNTYIYNNKLKLLTNILWQDLSPIKWDDSGERYYADFNGKCGASMLSSGSYTSQVYDIGANLQNIVSFNYDFYKSDNGASVLTEWRYSEDNINWSAWTLTNTGSFKFRYYQARITISNPNNGTVYINDFIVTVDVPDREENYTNREIMVAADGITITYATDTESKILNDFIIATPNVLVTPYNTNAYANATSSTATSCTVKLYDNSGTLTTGNVNIRVRGY